MKALWTESRVTLDGRFWQLKGASMEPKPFQKPYPPIWFGGSHPDALRRAVRLANGFFGAGSQSTSQFAEHMRVVNEALAASGREASTFPIAKRVYIAVDDDAERARRRIVQALDRLYGYFGAQGLDRVPVAGSPADCVRQLREVEQAGAQLILLNPLFDEAQQMERLAAEVVPQLATEGGVPGTVRHSG